jgi:glyoxylase-like metal-dependent hydrolase (beta-lactamase superfamily II)
MTYTGEVRPGGPAQVRDAEALTITKFSVSDMDNNCYLLRCRATGEQLLIDAADDGDRIAEVVGDGGVATVVTTHGHWDHVRATAAVVGRFGARSLAHPADTAHIPVDCEAAQDGDLITCGRVNLQVIHLQGHTPGSIALLYQESGGPAHLFTGDSLFPGGVGRTDSAAAFASLIDDVERKIFDVLPDDTRVYPGHGNDTTLGAERPHLNEWRERGW